MPRRSARSRWRSTSPKTSRAIERQSASAQQPRTEYALNEQQKGGQGCGGDEAEMPGLRATRAGDHAKATPASQASARVALVTLLARAYAHSAVKNHRAENVTLNALTTKGIERKGQRIEGRPCNCAARSSSNPNPSATGLGTCGRGCEPRPVRAGTPTGSKRTHRYRRPRLACQHRAEVKRQRPAERERKRHVTEDDARSGRPKRVLCDIGRRVAMYHERLGFEGRLRADPRDARACAGRPLDTSCRATPRARKINPSRHHTAPINWRVSGMVHTCSGACRHAPRNSRELAIAAVANRRWEIRAMHAHALP